MERRAIEDMICRLWQGWTTATNAGAYESLLRPEIFAGIAARQIPGFQGIDLIRCDGQGEVELMTIMWFASMEAVRAFAGSDHEVAVVPPPARVLLARFDDRSAHYDVVERRGAHGLPVRAAATDAPHRHE